jgi:hypothetical protein
MLRRFSGWRVRDGIVTLERVTFGAILQQLVRIVDCNAEVNTKKWNLHGEDKMKRGRISESPSHLATTPLTSLWSGWHPMRFESLDESLNTPRLMVIGV